MDAERVRIEIADGVADARMVRADKHNGLDGRMFTSLIAAIEQLAGDDELRAVVLSGDGPSFCAGLDFKSFTSATAGRTCSSARMASSPTSPRRSPTGGASCRYR